MTTWKQPQFEQYVRKYIDNSIDRNNVRPSQDEVLRKLYDYFARTSIQDEVIAIVKTYGSGCTWGSRDSNPLKRQREPRAACCSTSILAASSTPSCSCSARGTSRRA